MNAAHRTLVVALIAFSALVVPASAQHRRRTPTPPPPTPISMADAVIEWNVFVSAFHDTPARRTVIPNTLTEVTLAPDTGWTCNVGAPTRARIDDTNWSEVRPLTCTRGDAVVSTNGFCQIVGAAWGARAGILSLGTSTTADRAQVTLDCAVRN